LGRQEIRARAGALFFHIPIGFGKMMERVMGLIIGAGAKPEPDLIVMCDESSKWRSEVYLEVTKDVPGLEMTAVTGNFISKVFDGPYKDSAKWYKEMCTELASRGLPQKRLFAYYTTCPACAKKHGHNYVVLLAEV